jgi:hypothetical protein
MLHNILKPEANATVGIDKKIAPQNRGATSIS